MDRQDSPQVVNLSIRLRAFRLPPVDEALVVGKRAPVGSQAMFQALEEMSPGQYEIIPVEHETAEAVIVRRCELKRVPRDGLVQSILRHASPLLDPTESLHVSFDVEVLVRESLLFQE